MKEINAKYIFLDIVACSKRFLENQEKAIARLNKAVKAVLSEFAVPEAQHIFLPTGDGLCIVLINMVSPIDIHIQIALKILEALSLDNESCEELEKIDLRIGINENTDREVLDLNGQRNVVGSGINYAQRLMSIGDANQIFFGILVFEQLKQRASFASKIRRFNNIMIKHGESISAYQFIDDSLPYLNSDYPEALRPKPLGPIKTEFPGWLKKYFRYTIMYKDFLKNKNSRSDCIGSCYLLYFMALDEIERLRTPDHVKFYPRIAAEGRLEDVFQEFVKTLPRQSPWLSELETHLYETFSGYHSYFDTQNDPFDFRVISPEKMAFVEEHIKDS